jgi:hypothetical protein
LVTASSWWPDEQVPRLLLEGRERRVGAEEPDHHACAHPAGNVVAVDERGDRHAREEASRQVDHERAPGEHAEDVVLDQPVEAVAGEGAGGSAEGHREGGQHEAPFVVGAISRRGG